MRLRKANLEAPVVQTEYGAVRGKRFALSNGKEINAFLGIPYAKPPIGDLRFKKPQTPEKWSGILDAQRYKNRAVQKSYIWDQLEMGVGVSEDCLYLNVVAPTRSSEHFPDGYPVIFYIHGGGYLIDSAAKYNYKKLAKTLVSKNTIVVTVEYRLGYLGFLALDDKEAKGNFGIWDVVEGLKFVKSNAKAFGADPNKITVMGQSAGSCMADLLSLSPVSRDLFQQNILMAGFSDNSWAISNKELVVDFCRNKALHLGFQRISNSKQWTDEENKKCMEFLREIPCQKFAMTMIGDKSIINEMRLLLTPVLDDELFPKSIQELRNESQPKNSIVGVTKYEGLLFFPLGRRMANRKFLEFCNRNVGKILDNYSPKETTELMTLMAYQELYGINNDMMRKDKKAIKKVCVDIMSDLINGIGLQKHCIRSAQAGGTCYRYNFEAFNSSLTAAFNIVLPFTGSTHGTELPYIFDINIFMTPFLKTKADKRVMDVTTRLWTNFVKYGDPNIDLQNPNDKFNFDWKPVNKENPAQHLTILTESVFKEKLDVDYVDKLLPVLDAFYSTLSAAPITH